MHDGNINSSINLLVNIPFYTRVIAQYSNMFIRCLSDKWCLWISSPGGFLGQGFGCLLYMLQLPSSIVSSCFMAYFFLTFVLSLNCDSPTNGDINFPTTTEDRFCDEGYLL